jgi:hypothetical protein
VTDLETVETELRANGVDVDALTTGTRAGDDGGDDGAERVLELTYTTAFPGSSVEHGEMGRALNALIDLADDGEWDPARVEATVLRSPGDVLGTWHADPDWFRGLTDYRLSETEFSQRVLATLDESGDRGP